ncbi:MAG: RNA-binding transcriptional accessory protein [Bacteroidales bacterium]|nr:RNA-binding transcriptional accessory protein [Bacteroidales bacterium]
MNTIYVNFLCEKLGVRAWQVEQGVSLLEEGATVPFISRYRKERTGGMDEAQIAELKHWHQKFDELEKRKQSIRETIQGLDKLTPELAQAIDVCVDAQVLEDLYLPYRPKRKTRATTAKEKGMEPLALALWKSQIKDPAREVSAYLNEEVTEIDAALAYARDILAEQVAELASVRADLRQHYLKQGRILAHLAKGVDPEEEAVAKYRNYFDFSEPIQRAASHRILAVLRAKAEGILSVKVEVDSNYLVTRIERQYATEKYTRPVFEVIHEAVEDAYKRLLHPSIENETLHTLKERADVESIRVFGENLRQLLLAPPLGQKRVLAIDPGFRTGCKVVCLDAQGGLLHNETIYPHPPANEKTMAMRKLSHMLEAYDIEVVAIGNGTAGRETEAFLKRMALPEGVRVYSVSEDGASVYSASPIAREEFPDYDVTVRGAVSIGRRIMDPLAELVKIDPKSIGVGQYQHDVDQTLLKERLDGVVESCVNNVGVNLNTASRHLLSYVSGIGPALAQNIVDYRSENGPFERRRDLLKVKRLGEKAFEQCAGFLRIPKAANPLDNSAVHPERYALVEKMAKDAGVTVQQLIDDEQVRLQIPVEKYVSEEVGLPTLHDILKELAKPGRDPRDTLKVFEFSDEIQTIEDVKVGMELPGIVTNITNFGAFVDFGIKQNGLIHVSQMGQKFVQDPNKLLKIHQHIRVRVLEVDLKRSRIGLALVTTEKGLPQQ